MNSIEGEWQEFAKIIFKGTTIKEVQSQEMKKAFFAGYATCLVALNQINEPHITYGEAEAFLDSRNQEAESFYRKIIRTYVEGN